MRSVITEIKAFFEGERGRRVATWGRRLFTAALLGLLAYQMTDIGWGEIWRSLPTTPYFYAIFLLIYFSLPITETLIYRWAWTFDFIEGFLVFIKKRVFNKDVLGYSGEFYLYFWASKNLETAESGDILGVVKDNNLVSSIASTLFAVGVLASLYLAELIVLPAYPADQSAFTMAAIALVIAVVAVLGVKFRRSVFKLAGRALLVLFVVHLGRLILVNVLQIAQWAVVEPDVSLNVWLTLISLLIVTSRIPFLPARDLLFIGASVQVSQMLNTPSAGIAGMLLVSSVLDKSLNFAFMSALTKWKPAKQKADEPRRPAHALAVNSDGLD